MTEVSRETLLPLDLAPTVEGRIDLDFYSTPPRDTEAFLAVSGWDVRGSNIFEPAAGTGAILDACKARGAASGFGLEIDPDRAEKCRAKGYGVTTTDAILHGVDEVTFWRAADFLISNPPFTLALEFAERCARWAIRHRRPAALLLRLAFAETKGRAAFHAGYPSDLYVLSERPRFRTDRKGTDSTAYAWFVWSPAASRRWCVIPPRKKDA